jgi:hypothetical protein
MAASSAQPRAASRALAAAVALLLAGGAGAATARSTVLTNIPQALPTDLAAPLPADLLAAQDAVFDAATTVMKGTSMVCGAINVLPSGYSLASDLGDGFFRLSSTASASIAAVLAVRGL